VSTPGGGSDGGTKELVTVRLVGFPLAVHLRAVQQSDAMRREFQLIENGSSAGRSQLDELVFVLPRDVSEAAQQLGDILDEADAFCRSGHPAHPRDTTGPRDLPALVPRQLHRPVRRRTAAAVD